MPNRLARETSPYLLQHADNPVDWYPWGEEALALARRLDRPILLSIGYSACHWCHVMAQECFADPEVAALMNAHFVNIKVDREERPDLDHIYQAAHAVLTGRSGGWPLTVFLTPEQIPFFAGTYFPKYPRHRLPGLMDLLPQVARFYHQHRDEIVSQNRGLLAAFEPGGGEGSEQALTPEPLSAAADALAGAFDPTWGGFSPPPKFPRPAELEFALTRGGRLRDMALFTLEKMEQGGLFDQLGGGFFRYSVDARWAIPHFEKMLYDNGPLLGLYAQGHALTGNPRWRSVCEATVDWLAREMTHPQGAFYAALAADSEHEEGRFYVWTPEEAKRVLTPEEYAVAAAHYGLEDAPNFEGRAWHLLIARPVSQVARALGLDEPHAGQLLASARAKLFATRNRRVPPGRDDKILTTWNGLMIGGLARAARLLDRPDWLERAWRAVDFLRDHMLPAGRLCAVWKDGARLNAYLDDHAFLLWGLLECLRTGWRAEDLAFARMLAEALLARFQDAGGGFFFTSHDHEPLIHRPKPGYDQATPSGNGVAVRALQLLGHLLGEARYLEAARRALEAFAAPIAHQPEGLPTLLMALEDELDPPPLVLLRGPAGEVADWTRRLARQAPRARVFPLPNGLASLPPPLNRPESPTVNAWVCRGVECLAAQFDFEQVLRLCKACSLG
ncbi:MAG: thioredoxin domain-containing protein [Burkholderiales bacterium]